MPKTVNASVLTAAALTESKPSFLIEIALGTGTLYYAENNENITFPTGGQVYTALSFAFDKARSTITGEIDRVQMVLDNTDLTFSQSLASEEWQGKRVTIKRVFRDLLGLAAYGTTVFVGKIGGINITESRFQFDVVSPIADLELGVPRRLYQANCPWVFGGTECTADIGADTGAAETGSTASVIIDTANRDEVDDFWRMGKVTFTSGDLNGLSGMIGKFENATGELTMINPFLSAPANGDTYDIELGCDKTSSDCKTRHDNWENNGSFTGIPSRKL